MQLFIFLYYFIDPYLLIITITIINFFVHRGIVIYHKGIILLWFLEV